MRQILGMAKTGRELLKRVKYSVDYYQRENPADLVSEGHP